MTHPEYYTWKFQTLLIVPPALALCVCHVMLGGHVLQAWDFTGGGPSLRDWQFPVPYTEMGGEGAVFSLNESGPLARIDGLAIPADRAREVRIRLRATDRATGMEVAPLLWLHWAGGGLQFAGRSCLFEMAYTRVPEYIYSARPAVENRDLWSGLIQSLRIIIVLPQNSGKGYRVELFGIEVLE